MQVEKIDTGDRYKRAVEAVTTTSLPASFELEAPVLEGGEKEALTIHIETRVSDGAVKIYLISDSLEEIYEKTIEEAIGYQVAAIGKEEVLVVKV